MVQGIADEGGILKSGVFFFFFFFLCLLLLVFFWSIRPECFSLSFSFPVKFADITFYPVPPCNLDRQCR